MPSKLYEDSAKIAEEFGYSNIQDLTIECLRQYVNELRKRESLLKLKRILGSTEVKKRLTKEQKEMIANKHNPKRANEITKKYGLEDIKV